MVKKLCLVIVTGLFGFSIFAQRKDFQSWWAVDIKTNITDKIELGIAPELRLMNNSSFIKSVITEMDLSYTVTKNIRFGGQYRIQKKNYIDNTSYLVNRFGIYGRIDFKIDKFRFNYRAIYQTEYEGINHREYGNIPLVEHRHRIALTYYKKSWNLRPDISYELFFLAKPNFWIKEFTGRLSASLEYSLNKSTKISLGYKLQRVYFKNNYLTAHILAGGLSYRF